MKQLRSICASFVFLFFVQAAFCQTNDAQVTAYRNLVDSQHFTFEAQGVTPSTGEYRNLTSFEYSVHVTRDSLTCYLPYSGKVMMALSNTIPDQLNMKSHKMTYKVKTAKKGGWYVTIRPKDDTSIQEFEFDIKQDGTTNLTVTCPMLDPISFNGYIH